MATNVDVLSCLTWCFSEREGCQIQHIQQLCTQPAIFSLPLNPSYMLLALLMSQ